MTRSGGASLLRVCRHLGRGRILKLMPRCVGAVNSPGRPWPLRSSMDSGLISRSPDQEIPGPPPSGPRFPVPAESGNGDSLFPDSPRIGNLGFPVSRFWPDRESGIPSPIPGQIGNRGNGNLNWGFPGLSTVERASFCRGRPVPKRGPRWDQLALSSRPMARPGSSLCERCRGPGVASQGPRRRAGRHATKIQRRSPRAALIQ
jgi:hypothetical protein